MSNNHKLTGGLGEVFLTYQLFVIWVKMVIKETVRVTLPSLREHLDAKYSLLLLTNLTILAADLLC